MESDIFLDTEMDWNTGQFKSISSFEGSKIEDGLERTIGKYSFMQQDILVNILK